jgi:transposase
MVDRELRRRRWIIDRKLEGWRSAEIATALRIDERTVYRWWRVYRKRGWEGLRVKSHKPHTIHRTSQETVDLILQLRRTTNWGPCRIEPVLYTLGRRLRH